MGRTAIIVGGGIAGPAAAMALARVGVTPTLLEGRPAATDAGSYLTLCPNGLDALAAIDALDVARDLGFPTTRNVFWSDRGVRLGAMPLGNRADGLLATTLRRPDLSRALLDEAGRRGVDVRFDARVVSVDVRDGRAVATLADGTEHVADLLVGCDGIRSPTRRAIDPSAPEPRFVGLVNFGGYTPDTPIDAEPGAWHMIFGRRAFFGYAADDRGGVVWFANEPRGRVTPEERARPADAWKPHLAALFADDAGPAAALVAAGRVELAADDTCDLPHVPRWHRGPLGVIGDAAHAPSPSSGQGASLALEDAVVLARAVREAPDAPAALAAFERARRARVEQVVAQGARGGSYKTPGAMGRRFREWGLRVALRWFMTDRAFASLYDHHVSLS